MNSIPPNSNQPQQPQNTSPRRNSENAVLRRVSRVAIDLLSETATFPQITGLNSSTNSDEKTQFLKELDQWAADEKKQNPNNKANIKFAKKRILTCYNKNDSYLGLSNLSPKTVPTRLFQRIQNLTQLDLSFNQLSSFNPWGLNNLQRLYLNQTQLTVFDTSGLTNLTHLYLSHNQLSSFNASRLTNLQELHLTNNLLTAFDASELPNLRRLYLSENRLSSFNPSGLTNLQSLDLSYNLLTAFDASELPNLRRLHLNNNPDLQELPMTLGQYPDLTNLDIDNTKIPRSLVDAILASCQALRSNLSTQNLEPKIQLWKGYTNLNVDLDFINSFENNEKATIYEWLIRLEQARDFRTNHRNLATVVCNILKDLRNKEFKTLALTQMEANNERCQDRASMALNELYLSWQLLCNSQNLQDPEKLVLLLRAGKTLALRNAIGEQLKGRNDQSESVETYLYYEKILAKELNLLTCIENMSYEACAKDLDKDQLKAYIEKNYILQAAFLPILDKILESNDDIQNKLKKILETAMQELESLGPEPKQTPNESKEGFTNRDLEWQTAQGSIMQKKDKDILKVKIDFLEKSLRTSS